MQPMREVDAGPLPSPAQGSSKEGKTDARPNHANPVSTGGRDRATAQETSSGGTSRSLRQNLPDPLRPPRVDGIAEIGSGDAQKRQGKSLSYPLASLLSLSLGSYEPRRGPVANRPPYPAPAMELVFLGTASPTEARYIRIRAIIIRSPSHPIWEQVRGTPEGGPLQGGGYVLSQAKQYPTPTSGVSIVVSWLDRLT